MDLHGLLLLSLLMLSSFGSLAIISIDEHNELYGSVYPSAGLYGEDIMEEEPLFRSIKEIEGEVGASEASKVKVVNVANLGAKGDGTDATKEFEDAWSQVCASKTPASMLVPEGKTYLLKPITFSGPCKSNVSVMIKGTIEAPTDTSYWSGSGKQSRQWLFFSGINNLYIGGGGTINGNGQVWWKNSCKIDKSKPCKDAPTALTIYSSNNVVVENLMVKDAQQIHVEFEKCNNVLARKLTVEAPEKSPNTDGIHITHTTSIIIDNCIIGTGDDCISIVSGSQNVHATNTVCGPGHGISIGSLGSHQSEAEVSDVTVDTATLKGTTNGVRIKTWQGGSGYAKHIKFQNIIMENVNNPIIIDQNYCDSSKPCHDQKSAVQVSDVHYQNITGTSASDVAIELQCSKSAPCRDIVLQEIDLVRTDGSGAKSSCANVKWSKIGDVVPAPCA